VNTPFPTSLIEESVVTEFFEALSHSPDRPVRYSSHLIFFAIAFKITSCSLIIRPSSAALVVLEAFTS